MNKGGLLVNYLMGIAPVEPPAPVDEDTPYFAALGRLIVGYAAAETTVHLLARHLSGLSDAKARAIFSGMRLSELTERVRQMMQLDPISGADFAEVDKCLTHLGQIAKQRGNLVHRDVNYLGRALQVSNWATAKSIHNIEHASFDIATLDAMRVDCLAIYFRLRDVIEPSSSKRPILLEDFLRQPWRYKPPQPKKTPKPPRKVPRSKREAPPKQG
jgi:hypothetical protein